WFYGERWVAGVAELGPLGRTTLMSCEVVIKHNRSVIGPGGHYGVFEYQTGPGMLDAHTAVTLGPKNFEIPLPMFAVATFVCVAVVLFGLCIRLRFRNHETPAA